jgi:hypothetical protein
MGKRISFKEKRKAAPEWVFTWRRPGNPALSKWIAVLVTGALFALLLTSVRIQVAPPVTWAAPKASVIYVTDDAEGRTLKLLAREGGPFPSRFIPSTWDGAAALEQEVSKVARWDSPPYVPSLRDFPRQSPPPLQLADTGEPVLPKCLPTASAPLPVKLKPAPVIHPLSGISLDEIPRSLPPIDAAMEPAITSETWRFLVRLDSAGHVQDCVSLAGGDQAGPSIMEAWLRRVTFHPDPENPARWIAVGVGFTNQPEANGPDAH